MINQPERAVFLLYLPFFVIVFAVALYARLPADPAPYLWADESWRAYAILSTDSYPDFLQLMKDDPHLLLFSEWLFGKIGLAIFGFDEFAFRIWPLIFSLLSIVGAGAFLIRCGTVSGALAAVFVIGVGWGFIFYVREFKPYALDFALTAWSFFAALYWSQKPSAGRLALLAGTLLAASLFSIVFVFIYPPILAYLLHRRRGLHRQREGQLALALLGVPGCVFVAIYLLVYAGAATGPTREFWAEYYLWPPENIPFILEAGVLSARGYFGFAWPVLPICYVNCAIISWRRKDGVWLLLLTPLLFTAIASALQLYPLFGRPSFFLFGIGAMSVGYCFGHVLELVPVKFEGWWGRWGREAAGGALSFGLILSYLVTGAAAEGIEKGRQWPSPQAKKVFSTLAEHYRPGDAVKFNYGVTFPFLIYRNRVFKKGRVSQLTQIQPATVIKGGLDDRTELALCRNLQRNLKQIRQAKRVWFLTTFAWKAYEHYQKVLPLLGDVEVLLGDPRRGLILLKPDQAAAELDCSRFEAKEGRTGRS
ncbi:MAG: glycosyltransferase family 39 protein [Proteobacteria bacterium]|nr:glycosyltransferase family 39 protein [Pseudomonadota bacterium]